MCHVTKAQRVGTAFKRNFLDRLERTGTRDLCRLLEPDARSWRVLIGGSQGNSNTMSF
jgi:hypothetical protein